MAIAQQAPTLTTERLILRAASLDDWEAYAAAWADPRLTTFIGGQPRTRNESWGKFSAAAGLWALLGYGYWSIIDRVTGTFLGTGGLAQFERGLAELSGYPEAGWAFIPDAWGKGIATEAMAAVLAWADSARPEAEIRCIIDPANLASASVAAKLGFERIGEVDFPPGTTVVYRRVRRAMRP
jgi:RimJ/RimL family protein N-acetyltransferase